jgi:hypothetical protein
MRLHDEVADILFRCRFKKTPRPLNQDNVEKVLLTAKAQRRKVKTNL